jgi:ribosome biogenesis protein ENP2
VTAVSFRDGLNLAVGTSTGHVLLYDIRADRPLLVKDHMYGAPIKKVLFHATHDQVLSLDSKVLKIWDRATGKAYASIESESALNDVAVYPSSGLLFMTNEQPKMQVCVYSLRFAIVDAVADEANL